MKLLVEVGKAPVNLKGTKTGATALHWASQKGRIDVVRFSTKFTKCDGPKKDCNNNRLHYDTFSLVLDTVSSVKKGKDLNRFLRFDRCLVLEAGADVDLLTINGKTAAQLAREFGHGPMARFLEGRTGGRTSSSSSSSLGRGRRGRR